MNRFKVYVAGPYSHPDPESNTLTAIEAGDQLLRLGYAPFIPHLSHYWDAQHPHPYAEWLDWCLVWVKCCDAILRLPGASVGADIETELAYALDIPVYQSIEEMHAAFQEAI